MDLEFIIKDDNNYFNILQIIKEEFFLSDRLVKKLKNASHIYLNNKPIDIKFSSIYIGDKISIDLNFDEECENIVPTKMNLSIIYEDNYILVIDKAPYIAVHPSINHFSDTLSNGVKYYYNSKNLKRKIRIVNRLDKDTSRNSYIC